jgi:hypothetical protein
MKKFSYLILIIFLLTGIVNAQSGPSSTANWYGYILPPNPAEYEYVTFTMQDLGSVSVASDVIPAATTATFADGYVWSVNNDNGYNICRSRVNATNNFIEAPEVMVSGLSYINDMSYNPADGMIYIIINEHLKSFDPANPGNMQDHGMIEHDGFNLAINMDGIAYMISSWGEFGILNLANAQLTVINPIDLPIKMAFDMLTGELFGVYYGNVYQLDPNTGAYTNMGPLFDGSNSYDPTCLFMTYGIEPPVPVTFTVGDLNYRVNDDEISVTVTGHVEGTEATGELNIPETVSYEGTDYAVTVIGNEAFAYCSGLTGNLMIPNSVVTIEQSAFLQCEEFDGTLTVGEAVSYIGDWAFRKCSNISEVVSLATSPATLGDEFGCQVFAEFGVQTLTVPCQCGNAYLNSQWYDPMETNGFSEIVEDCAAVYENESVVTAVYPNPTKGIVKIEAENIQNISIFNVLGEIILETSVSGDAFEYDFSKHEAGLYFIKVETAKGVNTEQVTVL